MRHESPEIDEMPGRRGERAIDRDVVTFGQENIQRNAPNEIRETAGVRLIAEDLHAEPGGADVRNAPADIAHSNDTDDFAREFQGAARKLTCSRPAVSAQRRIELPKAAGQVEETADHIFGHSLGIRAGNVRDGNAVPGSRVNRDHVQARAMPNDASQTVGAFKQVGWNAVRTTR
jgi:hypothetical protein